MIRDFWTDHPVGTDFVGGGGDFASFLREYDARRNATEPHIREELEAIAFRERRVLEIGPGQGTEAQRMIELGAEYHGIDATSESIQRVRRRCEMFGLRYASLQVMQGDALAFADASFDIVFSHGVLHHSPRIERIVSEIHRVLRPGGLSVVMLYHRNSINYQLSIRVIRRLGILLLYVPPAVRLVSRLTGEPIERLRVHAESFRTQGFSYLRMDNFLHRSTDGPHNVFSSVFSETEASKLFSRFSEVHFRRHLLNERHLPVLRSILSVSAKRDLESRFGWHLWVFARR